MGFSMGQGGSCSGTEAPWGSNHSSHSPAPRGLGEAKALSRSSPLGSSQSGGCVPGATSPGTWKGASKLLCSGPAARPQPSEGPSPRATAGPPRPSEAPPQPSSGCGGRAEAPGHHAPALVRLWGRGSRPPRPRPSSGCWGGRGSGHRAPHVVSPGCARLRHTRVWARSGMVPAAVPARAWEPG